MHDAELWQLVENARRAADGARAAYGMALECGEPGDSGLLELRQ